MPGTFFESKHFAAFARALWVLRVSAPPLDAGRNDSVRRQILPGRGN